MRNCLAIVAGAGRGRAVVRHRHPALCHRSLERPHANRAGHQPGIGAAGIPGARGDAAGRIDRRSHHRRPHACSSSLVRLSSWYHSALPPLLALFVLTLRRPGSVEARNSGWAWRKTSEAGTPPR